MAQLQGQISFDSIAAKPEFVNAPPEVQEDVANRYFDDHYGNTPAYQNAPSDVQQDARSRFFQDYGIRTLAEAPQRPSAPSVQVPKWIQEIPDEIGYAAAQTALPFATAGKALTLDYLNAEDPLLNYARSIEQKYPESFAHDPRRIDSPYSQAGRAVSYGAGAIKNFQALEGLAAKGFAGLSARAAQYTTPLAEAAGVAQPWLKPLGRAADFLQSGSLGARVAKDAALVGGMEAARNQPNNERLLSGVMGAATGAALPVVGRALKGGISSIQEAFRPESRITGIRALQQQVERAAKKQLHDVYETLVKTFTDIRDGHIDPALVDPTDFARLVQKIEQVGKALTEGKTVRNPKQSVRIARKIEGKANVKAKLQKREVSKPKPEPSAPSTPPPSPPPKEPYKAPTLSGSVEKMVQESAASVDMKPDELVASKPKDLTPDQRDVRTNIMAVQKAESINPELGIMRQQAVNEEAQLLYGQVEQAVPQEFKGMAEKLNEALEKDKAIRIEYQAEELGRSNEAAKVTAKGNVKIEPTTFTPTFWKQTKDGKVMIQGYNQRGHFVSYHLAPSASGSQVVKVGKLIDKPFKGEYPNRVFGQREFRAADVLGRGARSVSGVIKTSEALTNAKAFATLFKPETIKQFSKPTQKIINAAKKRGQFDDFTIQTILKQVQKDKEELARFCNLMGLK